MSSHARLITLVAAFGMAAACSETITASPGNNAPDAALDAPLDVVRDKPDPPEIEPPPVDVACPSASTRCEGACVDTMTSTLHCGACGNACDDGAACASGVCETPCPVGQTSCEGTCQSLSTDNNNCGACGNGCALGLGCVEGVCTLVCTAMRTNCGGRCVDTQTSGDHCGACGNTCATGLRCVAGECHGDPCGPMDTAQGRCERDTIVRCVGGEITRETCVFGLSCQSVMGAAPTCAPASGARRITGHITFQNRPATPRGLIASRFDPVEGVPVALLDAEERVLVQGLTDAEGAYALAYDAPDGAMMHVRVALARTDSIYNFVVRDYVGATFSFTSSPFAASAAGTRDFAVTFEQNSGALSIYTAARRAFEFLRPYVVTRPAALFITWERNRATSTTNSSYFSGASSTMFINGSSADPDEFDPPVVSHEFGHYIQRWYSRSNNPGGPHDGTPADPRLAFGEGGASFLGSLITGSQYYIDAGVTRPRIIMDLSNIPLVRTYAASASQSIEQVVSEWFVAGAQYAMFRASSNTTTQTQRAMRVLTGYLRRSPTPDRGTVGVDLVDYLDGYLCVNAGAERSTIMSYVVDQRRFPYDFAFSELCR